jgi:hypothetical protein
MKKYHPNRKLRLNTIVAEGVLALFAGVLGGASLPPCQAADAQAGDQEMVPLPLKLPKPVFPGTPKDIPPGTTVEKPSDKPRPVPLVPKGTINLALNKKVTSGNKPFWGSLEVVTDGNKEAREDSAVELKPRLQWVQIDLGATSPLFYIVVWHFHLEPIVCHDVVVQVSNDPDFIEGVTTLFNNDQDNSAGLGIGKDREYFEMYEGKLIDAKGTKARYVRLYSNGSTHRDPLNRYTEVEVFGLPAK